MPCCNSQSPPVDVSEPVREAVITVGYGLQLIPIRDSCGIGAVVPPEDPPSGFKVVYRDAPALSRGKPQPAILVVGCPGVLGRVVKAVESAVLFAQRRTCGHTQCLKLGVDIVVRARGNRIQVNLLVEGDTHFTNDLVYVIGVDGVWKHILDEGRLGAGEPLLMQAFGPADVLESPAVSRQPEPFGLGCDLIVVSAEDQNATCLSRRGLRSSDVNAAGACGRYSGHGREGVESVRRNHRLHQHV